MTTRKLTIIAACWPSGTVVTAQAVSALFSYNLLTAFYLEYLGGAVLTGIFSGRHVFFMLSWRFCWLVQHTRPFGGDRLALLHVRARYRRGDDVARQHIAPWAH